MTEIVSATADVITMVGNVFTMITANPLLVFIVACGVLGTVMGVFRKLKSSAK